MVLVCLSTSPQNRGNSFKVGGVVTLFGVGTGNPKRTKHLAGVSVSRQVHI